MLWEAKEITNRVHVLFKEWTSQSVSQTIALHRSSSWNLRGITGRGQRNQAKSVFKQCDTQSSAAHTHTRSHMHDGMRGMKKDYSDEHERADIWLRRDY